MSYKIAVGSSDGNIIDEHFGTTFQFLIYEINGKEYKLIKTIESEYSNDCAKHHINNFSEIINKIGDCRAVLVDKIGPSASKALKIKNIDSFSIYEYVETALSKLVAYYYKIDGSKKNDRD